MRTLIESFVLAGLTTALAAAAPMTMGPAAEQPSSLRGQEGDNAASPELGLAIPVSQLHLSRIGAGNQSPGDPGLAVGARVMRQTSERLSLGGQIVHQNYGDRDFVVPGLAGTIGGSQLLIEALARYWLAEPRTLNPYVIGGVGVNTFSARVYETRDPSDVRLDATSVGLAMSAGAGLEGRFGKERSLVAGAELGWQLATIDSSKFGTSAFNGLGLGGRVGYKF